MAARQLRRAARAHASARPAGDLTGPRAGVIESALDKAVTVPGAKIHEHVDQLRRRNPYATPDQLVTLLEREYLRVIQGAGAAVGAAAAAPAVGTGIALALTVSDVATFFGASAAFSLAVASVHGIDVQDVPRRRALVLATILGEAGAKAVGDAAEISSVHFARTLLTHMPTTTIAKVNSTLTKRLIRRQVLRQSALGVGRLAPFGIGAVIGVAGARALGKTVIEGARLAFGPAPARFAEVIEVVAPGTPPRIVAFPSSAGS
ncbi:hypothetical protein [Cellulomonas sp.]|uniref:hypothetical protein n=1 Tax=Cellulomonas sp. TaxID=40001 RepID=UPI0025B8679B|nr:hypothetical protein [Cellulomonas sp.]